MADLVSQEIRRAGDWSGASDSCTLDYEARFLRRKVLTTKNGRKLLVDLAQTLSLDQGDAFETGDSQYIEIIAAPEPVLIVTGDLARLAWHIGNRHTPCQVEVDRLIIRADKVIQHMLDHLGAKITPATLPFTPEGGAYGHGRTHAHEHGATAHEHDHDH